MTPDRIARGIRAKELLDDSIMSEAFGAAEREYFMAFINAAHDDDALRRSCQNKILALHEVRKRLRSIVNDGTEAAMQNERA